LFNDPTAIRIARELYSAQRIVAAICIAPAILANAGILEGKHATADRSVAAVLSRGGAICEKGAGVVIDGRIITATGPAHARAFGAAIADALRLARTPAQRIASP
jgi:protease I